jgi:hypothetical protein
MRKSISLYIIFILIACVGLVYGNSIASNYANLRIWNIENVLLLLIGIPFIYLLPKAKLNYIYADQESSRNQIWFPVLIGIIFGILDLIVIEYILPHPQHTSLPPYTQPFPYSLFLFFSGALEIEVFYRLIPVTLFLLLFTKLKEGKYYENAFWIIAVITSIREPLEQFPSGAIWYICYALISGFAMNFIQVYYFKKYSFIASLSVRLGHYMVWHILNGIYIQYVILGT